MKADRNPLDQVRIPESQPAWRRVRGIVHWTAVAVALMAIALGLVLPFTLISGQSPPKPYTWPAHHALLLYDTVSTECTIDDGGPLVEVSIAAGKGLSLGGRMLPARAANATVTCDDGPDGAVLDPDWRYRLGTNGPFIRTMEMIGVVSIVIGFFYALHWFSRKLFAFLWKRI